MWITDHCAVCVCDLTVTVYVNEDHVTWLSTLVLSLCCVNLCLVLEDTCSLVTVEVTDRITHLYTVHLTCTLAENVVLTMDDTLGICDTCHDVLVVRTVDIDTPVELANSLRVVDSELDT